VNHPNKLRPKKATKSELSRGVTGLRNGKAPPTKSTKREINRKFGVIDSDFSFSLEVFILVIMQKK
jgi:hypothetical protein